MFLSQADPGLTCFALKSHRFTEIQDLKSMVRIVPKEAAKARKKSLQEMERMLGLQGDDVVDVEEVTKDSEGEPKALEWDEVEDDLPAIEDWVAAVAQSEDMEDGEDEQAADDGASDEQGEAEEEEGANNEGEEEEGEQSDEEVEVTQAASSSKPSAAKPKDRCS
jgi:hypothetical protein